MSKAILVIDMPDSCDRCPFFHDYYRDMNCVLKNNRTIDYPYPKDFRQDWCPLRLLPDRDETEYLYDEYDNGYCDGWNSFRREILGENDYQKELEGVEDE